MRGFQGRGEGRSNRLLGAPICRLWPLQIIIGECPQLRHCHREPLRFQLGQGVPSNRHWRVGAPRGSEERPAPREGSKEKEREEGSERTAASKEGKQPKEKREKKSRSRSRRRRRDNKEQARSSGKVPVKEEVADQEAAVNLTPKKRESEREESPARPRGSRGDSPVPEEEEYIEESEEEEEEVDPSPPVDRERKERDRDPDRRRREERPPLERRPRSPPHPPRLRFIEKIQ